MKNGLYIHVPFCKTKCGYCDFYRITDLSLVSAYVGALQREIKSIGDDAEIGTVYVGGGSPSVIGAGNIGLILKDIRDFLKLDNVEEITVECNPEDVNAELIEVLKENGVTRVSLGVQSLNNDMLRLMNRRHSASKVTDVVGMLKSNGFDNISVDIIFGLPKCGTYNLTEDIDKFINLDVDHISAYALSYEKSTVFSDMLSRGKIEKLPDDEVTAQYEQIIAALNVAGYEHYEISNFARAGKLSKHNCLYWSRNPYYGLGPSASGFDGTTRYRNVADVEKYVVNTLTGMECTEKEQLTSDDVYNEVVMLGMRTKFGVARDVLSGLGKKYVDYFEEKVQRFMQDGSVVLRDGAYIIDEKKWFVSDNILSYLFI